MGLTAGELADWVSGIGSLLAVAVALWVSVQARRDLMYDRLLQISAWVENLGEGKGWKLVIQNSTLQPVYAWGCRIEWPASDAAKAHDYVSHSDVGIIPPGHYEYPWSPEGAPESEAGIATTFVFRDAHGKAWTRLSTGSLRRSTQADQALLSGGRI